MNMFEDAYNNEDVANLQALEDSRLAQLSTTPIPSLSNGQVLLYEPGMQDGWPIDETPTMILPVIGLSNEQVILYEPGVQYRWFIDEMPTRITPAISTVRSPVTDSVTTPQKAVVAGTESPLAAVRKLIKSSGVYAIASVVPGLASLVLTPFLTHHLSPSDYGILAITNIAISLVAGITQLGLGSAFFRAYGYDYTSQRDKRDIVATVTTLLCLISVPTAIIVAMMAPVLASLLFGRPSPGNYIVLAGGVILLQSLSVPGLAWLRAEGRALFYSLLLISSLFVTLLATIYLIGVLHWGVSGSIIAAGSGYACIVICTLPIIILRTGIKIRVDIAQNLLAFGLPLVLSFVSVWVLELSDRYLLSLSASLAETARYAVAYTLGSGLHLLVTGPFTLAWPVALFTIAKRKDAAQVFRLVFRWFSLFLLFAAFALSLVGTVLLDWLFPVTYHSAAFVIPIIAGSIAFYGIYYLFKSGIDIKRKTWLNSVYTFVGALVNVTLNLVLIPHYGAIGAAMSTLFAYIVLALVAYVVNKRIYPVPFEVGRFVIGLLLGIALYAGSSLLAQSQGIYTMYGIYVCALVLYGGLLVMLAKLPAWDHKSQVEML